MKIHKLPAKAIRKLTTYAFLSFGRDSVSWARITSRSDLKQIGSSHGGWVIPANLLDADSICYCAGCGEDISFDMGLIDQFGCHVFAFDPTPRAVKHVKETAGHNPRYHFFEIGLWDREDTLKFYAPRKTEHVSHSLVNLQKTEEYIDVKVKRLQQIMEDNGHNRIDLLKMDIEGAEYRVIESVLEDGADIRTICVEYDECFNAIDGGYKKRIRASLNKLLGAGFTLVYAQGNGNYTFVKAA